jgi:hypothetical protein
LGVVEHFVETRPSIPTLGATDTGVAVLLDDLPATSLGNLV